MPTNFQKETLNALKENDLLKEDRKAYRSYITCLEREIEELQEEVY